MGMTKLREQASQCKSRKAEVQADLQSLTGDPETVLARAVEMENEVATLQQQLMSLRSGELVEKEQNYNMFREAWQSETARLAEIRNARDNLSRQQSDLERQVGDRWRTWRPMWSSRLANWNTRAVALREASAHGRQLSDAVEAAWELLREEQEARAEVLRAINE